MTTATKSSTAQRRRGPRPEHGGTRTRSHGPRRTINLRGDSSPAHAKPSHPRRWYRSNEEFRHVLPPARSHAIASGGGAGGSSLPLKHHVSASRTSAIGATSSSHGLRRRGRRMRLPHAHPAVADDVVRGEHFPPLPRTEFAVRRPRRAGPTSARSPRRTPAHPFRRRQRGHRRRSFPARTRPTVQRSCTPSATTAATHLAARAGRSSAWTTSPSRPNEPHAGTAVGADFHGCDKPQQQQAYLSTDPQPVRHRAAEADTQHQDRRKRPRPGNYRRRGLPVQRRPAQHKPKSSTRRRSSTDWESRERPTGSRQTQARPN